MQICRLVDSRKFPLRKTWSLKNLVSENTSFSWSILCTCIWNLYSLMKIYYLCNLFVINNFCKILTMFWVGKQQSNQCGGWTTTNLRSCFNSWQWIYSYATMLNIALQMVKINCTFPCLNCRACRRSHCKGWS